MMLNSSLSHQNSLSTWPDQAGMSSLGLPILQTQRLLLDDARWLLVGRVPVFHLHRDGGTAV